MIGGFNARCAKRFPRDLISCNLTKPEATFDTIRKEYEKLKPTDVALVATALVESGRHALCIFDGKTYKWPEDQADLTRLLIRDVEAASRVTEDETVKKTTRKTTAKAPARMTKAAAAKAKLLEQPVLRMTITIRPDQKAGEAVLGKRKELKTMLSDMLKNGVEFMYSPTDIGWHWSLERVNWSTLSDGELQRHVVFTPEFEGESTAVELGPGGKKRARAKRKPRA